MTGRFAKCNERLMRRDDLILKPYLHKVQYYETDMMKRDMPDFCQAIEQSMKQG